MQVYAIGWSNSHVLHVIVEKMQFIARTRKWIEGNVLFLHEVLKKLVNMLMAKNIEWNLYIVAVTSLK